MALKATNGATNAVELTTSGTIYTLISSDQATNGYVISDPSVSLVTLENYKLTYGGNAANNTAYAGNLDTATGIYQNMISLDADGHFAWVEASLDGYHVTDSADNGIFTRNTDCLLFREHRL